MYNTRCEKLLKKMEGKNIALITSDANVLYFSGFDGGESSLIITNKKKYLFTDFRYTEQATMQAEDYEIVEYTRINKHEKYLEILSSYDSKSIGIEKSNVSVFDFEVLDEKLQGYDFFDVAKIISDLRNIKSEEEIKLIRKSASINDEAFLKLVKMIKPGITEMDIYAELTYLFNKLGATHAFTPIIASGKNSSLPHAPITNKIVEDKDLLTIDFGAKFDNYCSDCTRTIGIGGLDNMQKKVYYVVKRAQELAIDAICSGVSAKEVDAVSREYINKSGFEGKFEHGLGHGLGLDVHEDISLSPHSNDVLEKNMVFSVEPGVYLKGEFGVRIEDIGTIVDNKYECFNSLYKDLIII